jgi:hypothetical protein
VKLRYAEYLTDVQRQIIDRIGATAAGAARALDALTGDFLTRSTATTEGECLGFRHPTLWEGFAVWLSTQHHLMPLVLAGLDDRQLVERINCQTAASGYREGELLRVPPSLYATVAERVAREVRSLREAFRSSTIESPYQLWWGTLSFLSRWCSDDFLKTYLEFDPELPRYLARRLNSYLVLSSETAVLARLHTAGLLPGQVRQEAIDELRTLAVETPDAEWLRTGDWSTLLTEPEKSELLDEIRDELLRGLVDAVGLCIETADSRDDYAAIDELETYKNEFDRRGDLEASEAFAAAMDQYNTGMISKWDDEDADDDFERDPVSRSGFSSLKDYIAAKAASATTRSTFDDIDA